MIAAPLSSRALLTLLLVASVLGCAAKPPEKPIVLRQYHPERRRARLPATVPPEPAAVASEAPPALSPDDKENLFRSFEDYLSRTGKTPGDKQ